MENVNNANQNAPAPARGGRGRGRGGAAAQAGPARAPAFLNPENPPDIIAKFRKELGKTIEEISVVYTAEGTKVSIKVSPDLKEEGEEGAVFCTPVEYGLRAKRFRGSQEPSAESALDAQYNFVRLYEKRLDKAFPVTGRPATFDEAAIKRWVLTQPFEDRKVLMMNAKTFRAHSRQEEEADDDV